VSKDEVGRWLYMAIYIYIYYLVDRYRYIVLYDVDPCK